MLSAIIWGLVQGLTEFLPISSSGHLVIVPAFLAKTGLEVAPPSLAVSAFLHLGTLAAALVYFRSDIAKVVRFRSNPEGRKIALLIGVGAIPAAVGLPLESSLESFQDTVSRLGWALMATGLALLTGQRLTTGARRLIDGRVPDAILIGLAQSLALVPGVSRSGMTISAGIGRRFDPEEAARYAFLLGIPAIAGAGLLQLPDLIGRGDLGLDLVVGMLVAAVSGHGAIAWMLKSIKRVGLYPFAVYCLLAGLLTVIVF